jgi:hypothetical protein
MTDSSAPFADPLDLREKVARRSGRIVGAEPLIFAVA